MRPKAQALPRRSGAALLAAMALTTGACGQKSGVADQVPLSLGSGSEMNGPDTALPEGTVQAAGSELVTSGSATVMSDGSTQGATTDPAGGSSTTSPEETAGAYEPLDELIRADKEPMGGSRTGVTNDTITIGMHFPKTPAINPEADLARFDIYWDYIKEQGRTIFGRDVRFIDVDDATDPGTAASRCRELVEEDQVFLVIGYAYPAVIQACAQVLAKRGVPYFAPGSGEATVASYPNHFSISAPYTRQAATVANLLVTEYNARKSKNALIRSAGGARIDAQRPIVEMEKRGAKFDYIRAIEMRASPEELAAVALDLKRRGVKNIWLGGSPFHFHHLLKAAEAQRYFPRVVGAGPTVVYDSTLKLVCGSGRQGHGSLFLHPYPGFTDRQRFDPEFNKAGGSYEVEWWLWSISRKIEQILRLPGRNLTRERLMWHLARDETIHSGVMPPVKYSPQDHFTSHSMHLLRAHCARDNSRWVTVKPFLRLLR